MLRTVLIVGEGDCEIAFLNHLKALYVPRGSGVRATLRNAHGKGPEHVVDYAVRQCRNADYDLRAALLDTDLTWPARLDKQARARRILLIPSSPCLEGLLLRILAYPVPESSSACKETLHRALDGKPTQTSSYERLFDRETLDQARGRVKSLAHLLTLLQGLDPRREDTP